ncbi:MAG: hypothetical protein CL675_12665 [Bdellovibrionaceae bacterium]|nr:hypothetical protein [Pseudobdellovibrionaceae bacterium]
MTIFKRLFHYWKLFGKTVFHGLALILLVFTFYMVLTPLGWLRRKFSKAPVQLNLDPEAKSYFLTSHPESNDSMTTPY